MSDRFARRAALLLSLLAISCNEAARGPAFAVRDSAGVAIVESARPTQAGGWSVGETPLFDVGTITREAALDFIRGVHRFEDGRVVVATAADARLHYYGADGTPIRSTAGYGVGAGLLARIRWTRRSGDTLLVGQGADGPIRLFDASGDSIGSLRPDSVEQIQFASEFWPYADGSFGVLVPPQGLIPRRGEWFENAVFLHARRGAKPERAFTVRGAHFATVPNAGVRVVVWSPIIRFEWGDDAVYAGFPSTYRIDVHAPDGRMLRSLRRVWQPVPVSRARMERFREFVRAQVPTDTMRMPPEEAASLRAAADSIPFADHHPAYERLLLDQAGRLWVAPPDPDWLPDASPRLPVPDDALDWDVFDVDGAWLATVSMPARFYPTEIGDTWVAGIWRDAAGHDRARVYALESPAPG